MTSQLIPENPTAHVWWIHDDGETVSLVAEGNGFEISIDITDARSPGIIKE